MNYYNRKKYVENYALTKDEFLLLPYGEELAYTEKRYAYILESLKNVGDSREIRGQFPAIYDDYFRLNGIVINRYDFGIAVTEFVKKKDISFKAKEETINEMDTHVKLIANAKASVFESMVRDFYKKQEEAIRKGEDFTLASPEWNWILEMITSNSIDKLGIPDDLKRFVLYWDVFPLTELVNTDGEAVVSLFISSEYVDFLEKMGYTCEEKGTVMKVLKGTNKK